MAEYPDEDRRGGSPDRPIHVSGEDARGGEIILRTRRRRIIFLSGLIGFVLLALIVRFVGLG